jgi:DHA1 family inner membrane transport protein
MDKEDPTPFGGQDTLVPPLRPRHRALPWALLTAACLGSFATSSSGTTRAPFLLQMAQDLDVSMPLVANLVSLTATSWGITSATGGMLSDLIGRRMILIGGMLALAVFMVLQATAGTFTGVAAWATAAGGACGLYTGVIFAEVSVHVEDGQRGRALGWVMSGQSLALVVGVPLAAWVGSWIGWRGWNVCVAALALIASVSLVVTLERSPQVATHTARRQLAMALSTRVLALLGTGIAERVCFGVAAVYYATFLQAMYGLSIAALAIPLGIFALGNVAGTILGGQLADRLRDRLATFAIAMLLSAVAALALFLWHPQPWVSVGLGFIYVLFNAVGRPSYMAALAAVPEQVRGTVLGLNGAAASVGWIGAAALGAAMIATVGFEGFGPLAALLAVMGAAGAMLCRRMSRR